jgi:hypothetical protein
MHTRVDQNEVQATATPPNDITTLKSNLDLAWGKIESGNKLWLEGAIELINTLYDARQHFPADQEFGKWLDGNGYGEERITRNDRAALLNMALNLDVTREVLAETHRRSWRLIWEEEIQPRLHSPVQPNSQRPKKNGAKRKANRVQKPEGLRNIEGWYRDQVATVNAVINELNNTMDKCDPEQRKQLAALDPSLLLDAAQNLETKSAEFADWVDAPLAKAADELQQQGGRVVVTPDPNKPIQPSN